MEETVPLDPDIRVEDGLLIVSSRIRFTLAPESRGLVMQMRAAGTAQELWNSRNSNHHESRAIHDRGIVWPLDDQYEEAVMECTFGRTPFLSVRGSLICACGARFERVA